MTNCSDNWNEQRINSEPVRDFMDKVDAACQATLFNDEPSVMSQLRSLSEKVAQLTTKVDELQTCVDELTYGLLIKHEAADEFIFENQVKAFMENNE